MNLVHLPVETLTHILLQLNAKQISLCRRVCKRLLQLIDVTPSIQYHIELLTSSTLDNPLSRLPIPKKLAHLRQHNRAWRTLRPTRTVKRIPVHNNASVYELAGGYFFQDVNRTKAEAEVGLPSTLRWMDLPGRMSKKGDGVYDADDDEMRIGEWSVGFKVADLCLDVERDLIVLVERTDDNSPPNGRTITLMIHLRQLSTNEQHPDAHLPYLKAQVHVEDTLEYRMIVQICGDHVGLLLLRYPHVVREGGNDSFYVWNWTNATRKGFIQDPTAHYTSFCFTSSSTLLLPDTVSNQLHLYTLSPLQDSLRHTASLLLPSTIGNRPPVYIAIRTDPPEAALEPRMHTWPKDESGKADDREKVPFRTNPQNAVVIVTLDYIMPNLNRTLSPSQILSEAIAEHQQQLLQQQLAEQQQQNAEQQQQNGEQQQQPQNGEGQNGTPPPIDPIFEDLNDAFDLTFEIELTEVFAVPRKTLKELAEAPERFLNDEPGSSSSAGATSGTPSIDQQPGASTAVTVPTSCWTPYTRWGLPLPPPRWVSFVHGARYVSVGPSVSMTETRGAFVPSMSTFASFRTNWGSDLDWLGPLAEGEIDETAIGAGNTNGAPNGAPRRRRFKLALRVCDFDVEGIHRDKCLSLYPPPTYDTTQSSILTTLPSDTYESPQLFPEPVICKLRYRIIQTKPLWEWDSVLVDGERVVGMREDGVDGAPAWMAGEDANDDEDGIKDVDVLVF